MHKSIVRRIAALAVFLLLGGVMSLAAIAQPSGKCDLPRVYDEDTDQDYFKRTGHHIEEYRKKCPFGAAWHGFEQGREGSGGGIYGGPPGLQRGGGIEYVIGGNIGGGWSRNTYSDFPTFDGSGAGGGVYGAARYYVQPNFFVGPEAGVMLHNINARNSDTAFGFVRTEAYLGGQAGVTVRGPGASKINIYTGVDADWSRIVVGVEAANERMSKYLGGWSVHGGVEIQPYPAIPNLWLGLDLRHSDVSGTIGVDPTHVRWNMLSLTLSIQR